MTIGACYLAGALGTVCYGEIAATRPAPTEEVEVDVAGAPDSEAKPGVGRVKQDAFLVPPPDAPAGSITRNLFESPLPNGVTLTQIGAREGATPIPMESRPSPIRRPQENPRRCSQTGRSSTT